MRPVRSTLVVLIAAATGAVLGRGAGAVGGGAPVAATPATLPALAASASDMAPAKSASPMAHGEGDEPDEPRGDDNPYDTPAPSAHPASPRFQVTARDGMLKLPGAHFTMGSPSPRAPANERPVRAE